MSFRSFNSIYYVPPSGGPSLLVIDICFYLIIVHGEEQRHVSCEVGKRTLCTGMQRKQPVGSGAVRALYGGARRSPRGAASDEGKLRGTESARYRPDPHGCVPGGLDGARPISDRNGMSPIADLYPKLYTMSSFHGCQNRKIRYSCGKFIFAIDNMISKKT